MYVRSILKPVIIAGFFIFALPAVAIDLGQYQKQLEHADKIKSSNNKEFSELLTSLQAEFESLSSKQKFYFLYLNAYSSAYKGEIDQAITKYKHIYNSSDDIELRYRASLSLVNVSSLKKNWQESFEYLDFVSTEYLNVSNVEVRHQGLMSIAFFYNELEQYEMAKIYTARLLEDNVSGRNLCITLGVKLKADLSTLNFNNLEQEIFNAINTCKDIGESMIVFVLKTYLGSFYISDNKPNKTIELLEPHLDEIYKTKYRLLIVETNGLLASAYLGLKKFSDANKYAQMVIADDSVKQYLKIKVEAYRVLSTSAKFLDNYNIAFDFQEKYIEAKESLFEQIKAKQLAIESAKHRAIERENEISILNNQNKILQLEQKVANEEAETNRWIISLLFVSVSIMLLWLFYIKKAQRRLKYLAEYDGLTRICNRTHFTESASTELKNLSKSNVPASLIMFDLDHFKQINDRYGHVAGDSILQKTAHVCARSIRKPDIFGRVGGEEFAIILPRCNVQQAMKIAEECRRRINSIDTEELGIDFTISASFGVTESGTCGYQLKDLLASADKAMYKAKAAGRDRVVLWQTTQKD